ncbi:MAG: Uma2 family endonuclease [Chloroflexi bacterium]|nr:Uma2 family endonuclease [Chloroflexota bacterium]
MSATPIFEEETFAVPTYAHGAVILNLGLALIQHDPNHGVGRAFGPQTTYPMVGDPPTREPDLTWVRAERIPTDLNVDPDAPPDLAVEVISRTDTHTGTDARVKQYLASGIQVVWIIDPWMRTVTVYKPDGNIQTITAHGTLTGDSVISGFAIPVSMIFE